MKQIATFSLLLMAISFSGCDPSGAHSTAPSNALASTNAPAGKPQPKLPTLKLWIGPHELTAELAVTPAQIQTGMMFRTNIAENEGMLFIFARPHRASFWMQNTLIPLSGAYIDSEGTILEVLDMKALDETPLPAKSDKVQYVLETKHGWFDRHKVGPGVAIRTERGTLSQTFFGR